MLALAELELPYQINHVRIYRGENFADGFEKLHPHRKLPVLVDASEPGNEPHTVFESGAILWYLAERSDRMLGETSVDRSIVMQWLMFQMSTVGPAFGNATHFLRAAPADQDYARRRFVSQAIRICETYDARLNDEPYVAGQFVTIADLAAFPWLWRHPGMLGIDLSDFPHLQRWVDAIRARPAFGFAHKCYKDLVAIDMEDLAGADPALLDRFLGRGDWFLAD